MCEGGTEEEALNELLAAWRTRHSPPSLSRVALTASPDLSTISFTSIRCGLTPGFACAVEHRELYSLLRIIDASARPDLR